MDPSPSRQSGATAWLRGKRWLWLAPVVALLALAWFDGGEEPLHPIAQEIAVPEAR